MDEDNIIEIEPDDGNYTPGMIPEFDINQVHDVVAYTSDQLSELTNPNTADENLGDVVLTKIYKDLRDKYGLPIQYSDFNEMVSNIINQTKTESDIAKILLSKITSVTTVQMQTKLTLGLYKSMDRAVTIINNTLNQEQTLSGEVLAGIDKLIGWNNELKAMRAEAEAEYADPDKSLDILVKQDRIDQMDKNTSKIKDELVRKLLADIQGDGTGKVSDVVDVSDKKNVQDLLNEVTANNENKDRKE